MASLWLYICLIKSSKHCGEVVIQQLFLRAFILVWINGDYINICGKPLTWASFSKLNRLDGIIITIIIQIIMMNKQIFQKVHSVTCLNYSLLMQWVIQFWLHAFQKLVTEWDLFSNFGLRFIKSNVCCYYQKNVYTLVTLFNTSNAYSQRDITQFRKNWELF